MSPAVRNKASLRGALTFGVCLVIAAVATAGDAKPDWEWLYPFDGSIPVAPADPQTVLHLPGSDQSVSKGQLRDLLHAVDWFPDQHPAPPRIVTEGHDRVNACGFCHLPTGNGRPENSALAGLPADYIKRQVRAFADGSRRSAVPDKTIVTLMADTARGVQATEVDDAAAYFSKLPYVSYVKVVEATTAPFRAGRFIYVRDPGHEAPVGDRIIEVPLDLERFEQRDPHMQFIAYVPPGSIAAGQRIVSTGGAAGQPCGSCHGLALKGGIAPPLAGRSPSVIIRQLAAFQTGARSAPEAAPMRLLAGQLSAHELVAAAAYAATLTP